MKTLIKTIYNNVLSLYRDFFHWNIAKICIEVWSLILGVAFALPFFLVLMFLWFIDSIPWLWYYAGGLNISPNDFAQQLSENMGFIIVEWIFLILTLTMLILWWSYKAVLRIKLVKEYYEQNSLFHKLFDGVKRKLFWVHIFRPSIYKSYFSFDKSVFFCYVKLIGWISLYLLIPFLLCLAALIIVIVAHKGDLQLLATNFVQDPISISSIFLFVTFISSIFLFFYYIYRLYFSLMILVDHAEKVDYSNAKALVSESFAITKGFTPLIKFLWVYVVFWVILIPFILGSVYVDDMKSDLVTYYNLKAEKESGIVSEDFDNDRLTQLGLSYWELSLDEIESDLSQANAFEVVFSIFMFLVFTWYFDMVFFSLYKNYFEKRVKV